MVYKPTTKKTRPTSHFSSEERSSVPGILMNRERPITAGWCGNDNCEHHEHKQRRAAQAAADTRANK